MQITITSSLKECIEYMNWRMKEICSSLNIQSFCNHEKLMSEDTYDLTLNFDEKLKEILEIELITLIAEGIEYTFKQKFFHQKIKVDYFDRTISSALRTSYALFDRSEELSYYNSVRLGESVSIDGIYNFLLSDLKENWKTVCNLFSSYDIYNKDYAVKVIRHMLEHTDHLIPYAKLCGEEGSYELFDIEGEQIDLSHDSLLNLLIWLNPKKLEFDLSVTETEGIQMLQQLFQKVQNFN